MSVRPSNLPDWLAHIERQHSQPIALGLERVRVVQTALGRKQTCPVIVVGGTNGKFHLRHAGASYAAGCVGLYTSHLLRYNGACASRPRRPDEALRASKSRRRRRPPATCR
jgi:dihydrofolate synthase/folylpolyglutamate synthase